VSCEFEKAYYEFVRESNSIQSQRERERERKVAEGGVFGYGCC
jgi:hypothetical protein